MRFKVAVVIIGSLAALVAGCGSSKKASSSSTPATTSSASTSSSPAHVGAPGAKVTFVKPKGGTFQSSTVTAIVNVTGFTLSPSMVGKHAKQGFGHLHFSLNNGKYDYPKYSGPNGLLAVKLGVQGKYSPAVTPTITYKGLPKGKYMLLAYLANNDHTNTGVQTTTTFTVK